MKKSPIGISTLAEIRANVMQIFVAIPKAFIEQGLYMLATILKSTQAIQTTIAIVQTFAQVRE